MNLKRWKAGTSSKHKSNKIQQTISSSDWGALRWLQAEMWANRLCKIWVKSLKIHKLANENSRGMWINRGKWKAYSNYHLAVLIVSACLILITPYFKNLSFDHLSNIFCPLVTFSFPSAGSLTISLTNSMFFFCFFKKRNYSDNIYCISPPLSSLWIVSSVPLVSSNPYLF